MNEDPILEKARQLRAAGASIDEVRQYLASKGYDAGDSVPRHSKFTPEQLVKRADRVVAQSEDELEAAGGYNPVTHKIIGTAASLARDVPGAEAAQAFVSSRANDIPYTEALGKIREVESDAGAAGTVARIGGGALAASLVPGSPVLQGARYGMAHGLAQADPATLEERLHDAALQGSVGAVAPLVPGAAKGVGKWAASNGRLALDAALTPVSQGARVRTTARLMDLVQQASKRGVNAEVPAVARPMVEGYRPIGETIEREAARVLPFRSPAAKSPQVQLEDLLQKNLDEGMEAAESVKGYPISGDPPTNHALMRRLEDVLMGRSGAARATPRKGVTTPQRTVADVLRGGRR